MPGGDRDKDGMAVWMDCVKDNQPVPTWRNTIVAKVTRTGVEDEEEDDDDFVNGGAAAVHHHQSQSAPPPRAAPAPAPPQQSAPRAQARSTHSPAPDLDIFGGPSPPAAQANPTSAPSTGNLLDGHHHPAPSPASGGLLDMDAPYGGASNTAHNDFLGMTAPAPVSGGYNPQQQQQQYGQQPPGQPQQQQQQQPKQNSQQNAFNNFSQQQGPFGGLNWS